MGNSCGPPPLDYTESEDKPGDDEKYEFVSRENRIKNIKDIFEMGKCLGSGVSCSVFIGKMKSTGKKYAVKEMVRDDEFNPRSFCQEVDFLTSLSPHPNILAYHDAYMTDKVYVYLSNSATCMLIYVVTALLHCHRAVHGRRSLRYSVYCNYKLYTLRICDVVCVDLSRPYSQTEPVF